MLNLTNRTHPKKTERAYKWNVLVENYTIPLEDEDFFLYEVYNNNNSVVLKRYLSFYFDEKEFIQGTPILHGNLTWGYVIGNYLGYYAIANLKTNMYCGYYDMEQMLKDKFLTYAGVQFHNFKHLRMGIIYPPMYANDTCFVYQT